MEDLDTLYNYAKFQYECGNYSGIYMAMLPAMLFVWSSKNPFTFF